MTPDQSVTIVLIIVGAFVLGVLWATKTPPNGDGE